VPRLAVPAPFAAARPSFACQAVNPEKNGAYEGSPIVSGPISVGAMDTKEKGSSKPVDRSKGLWTRCDKCGVILYIKHLKEHHHICFGCNYHLKMSSQERIDHMIDPGAAADAWQATCMLVQLTVFAGLSLIVHAGLSRWQQACVFCSYPFYWLICWLASAVATCMQLNPLDMPARV
jgi:hypothetical protein